MLKAKTLTAIVPARGGSKGLPGKNLLELGGEPLVARAARLAGECTLVDKTIVSSDDPKILAAGAAVDGAIAIARPASLAGDNARIVDVIRHLVEEEAIGAGYILLLQPTSPLRSRSDLAALLERFAAADAPAMVSVCAVDEPRPEKLQRIEDGFLVPYLDEGFEGPRQALPQPYALNGAFYLIDRDVLLETGSFLPPGTMPFEMTPQRSANIDSPLDWQILQAMLSAGHWTLD